MEVVQFRGGKNSKTPEQIDKKIGSDDSLHAKTQNDHPNHLTDFGEIDNLYSPTMVANEKEEKKNLTKS